MKKNMGHGCEGAVGMKCDEKCEKQKCEFCKKHKCPICKAHYYMMVFADNEKGCCVGCVKISTNDTEPFYPNPKRV